jgi:hypothetical protein
MIICLCLLALLGAVQRTHAGDRGAQRYTVSLPLGAGSVTPIPTGGYGSFAPSYLVFSAAAGETQTVSYVTGAITNTVGTKVIASGSVVLAITNVPPMFAGDSLVIASSVTTGITNSVVLVGDLWE